MTPLSRVLYTNHAREQMVERQISAAQVERTITSPSHRYPSLDPPGRMIAERTTDQGNTLRVVYAERTTPEGIAIHVITVIRIRRKRR